jgi:FtsZ-binding cell division protein ZapB
MMKTSNRLSRDLRDIKPSAAAVITRPPEIITCLKVTTSKEPIFIIFDSHPRPKHPDGAAMIFYASLEAAATYLSDLLAVDENLLSDSHMQWQTQLLANFCAHIFVPRGVTTHSDLTQAVLRSSLAILTLQDELSELKFQNGTLTSENRRLETETEEAETRHNREVSRLQKELTDTKSLLSSRTNGRDHFVSQNGTPEPDTDYQVAATTNKGKMKSTLEYEWLDPCQMDVDSECSEILLITNTQAATTSSNGKKKGELTFEWLDPETLLEAHANAERSEMEPDKHCQLISIPTARSQPPPPTMEG